MIPDTWTYGNAGSSGKDSPAVITIIHSPEGDRQVPVPEPGLISNWYRALGFADRSAEWDEGKQLYTEAEPA